MKGSTRETVFVDNSFLVAVIDPRDALHRRALELAKQLDAETTALLTTDAVVIELANYFARSPLRPAASAWIQAIRQHADWEILPLEQALVLRGEACYRRFQDKTWSLTDCISMEVMKQRKLREAATADRGFDQAGFRALLR